VNDDHIINALKNSVIKDRFYGVSIEAASALGMFTQSNQAYESIKECINIITDQKIKNQLINSLSQFEKEDKDMLNLFIRTLKDEKESYLVRSSTATAIGNITYKNKNIEEYITLLKETVKENNSIFKDRIAKGAISAIKKFANTNDEEMLSNIMDFLIWISDYKSRNTNRIRDTATATLGYFLIKRTKDKGTEINLNVFNHLEYLLKDDPWWKTRNNAIAAILVYFSGNGIIGLDKESIKKALDMLEYAIRTDVHAQVRENAQKAVEYINKSQIDPTKIEKVKRHIIKSITQRRLLYK
jgi:HEAT repeat protein